mgnify:CR=1 FL=1
MADTILRQLKDLAATLPDQPIGWATPNPDERLMSGFYRHGPCLFLVCDPQTHTWLVNAAWESILGWGPDESQKKRFKLFHPGDAKALLAAIRSLGSNDTAKVTSRVRKKARVRKKGGGYTTVQWTAKQQDSLFYLVGEPQEETNG